MYVLVTDTRELNCVYEQDDTFAAFVLLKKKEIINKFIK